MKDIKNIISSEKPNPNSLPGFWEPEVELIPNFNTKREYLKGVDAQIIHGALSNYECELLLMFMMKSPNFEGVSVQGRKDVVDDRIGSLRTSIWSQALAESLFLKIKNYLEPTLYASTYMATDWWQGKTKRYRWDLVGMSPLLRFMKYEKGGEHYAHYDAGYIYKDDNVRTLKSVVIYLTTCEEDKGGATRFIKDEQENIPIWDRNHLDWTREVLNKEVIASSRPMAGNILIFNHRECHDVEQYLGDTPRIIIRTDLIYQSI